MTQPIRFRDDPPPLPDGYVLTGPTAHWQYMLNRIAWYIQRRLRLEHRFSAHTFTSLFTMVTLLTGAGLLYATPDTAGLLHWILLALFIPIFPFTLWVGLTTLGVFHEKSKY